MTSVQWFAKSRLKFVSKCGGLRAYRKCNQPMMFRFGWHVLLCWPQNMTDAGLTMYFKDVQRALHRNQPTQPLLCGHWYQRWVSSPVHMHVTASDSRQNYNDVIKGAIASQITSLTIVYPTVYLDADQRKHQSSASLAFVRGIHRWPVNSPHKWPVTRKMFPFDDVIMSFSESQRLSRVFLHSPHDGRKARR